MTLIKNLFIRSYQNQKGTALVIMAAAIAVMIGFTALVTDIGLITVNRQHLVNLMDATALSGAQELPDEALAVEVAIEYAQYNNFDPNQLTYVVSADRKRITVSGNKDVNLAFAKIFGFYSKTVAATATAELQSLISYYGVAPMIIRDTTILSIVPGELTTLKFGNPDLAPGNFAALSLSGTDDTAYINDLINGYQSTLRVGQDVSTKPGNMAGPTADGITTRIAQCHDACTFDSFVTGCPRVVIIPVYKDQVFEGRSTLTICGFTSFFIKSVLTGKDKDTIEGYFIETIQEGETNASQMDYGVTRPVLVI
jgi:Flp pilus assembly protein TadG